MKYIPIERRRLPLSFRHIATQLNAPPIFAILWFIWLWICAASIAAKEPMSEVRPAEWSWNLGSIGFLIFAALNLLDIASASLRVGGRKWLMTRYRDEVLRPVVWTQVLVFFAPFLSILSVLVFWIDW
jgi:hypothetical protein